MKKTISIILALFSISNVLGSAVFRCNLPVSPFDSDFQQGQELYLDVDYIEEKPVVSLYRSFGPKVIVNESLNIKRFGFSNSYSAFSLSWSESQSYLSMVYLGGKSWGAYLKYENPAAGLPVESELICSEKMDVTEL